MNLPDKPTGWDEALEAVRQLRSKPINELGDKTPHEVGSVTLKLSAEAVCALTFWGYAVEPAGGEFKVSYGKVYFMRLK